MGEIDFSGLVIVAAVAFSATGAALIAAGLLSVLASPLLALTLLRRGQSRAETRIAAAPHPTTP